ncbi:MAG TPA: hypothetical protein PKN32_05490 [Bacteroidales bacterium]|nr:hypothetical protein [Bacteroidales bacterium]
MIKYERHSEHLGISISTVLDFGEARRQRHRNVILELKIRDIFYCGVQDDLPSLQIHSQENS